MRIVVVGGQARKVGKTSVIVGLIRGLRQFQWTAVKISAHREGIPHAGNAAGASGGDPDFILEEESIPSALTDTGRFLAAGARRAFWLRARSEGLQEAIAFLLRSLASGQTVIIESGSAMNLITPRIGIVVFDRTRREMKTTVRRALSSASAAVEVESSGRRPGRPLRLPPGVRRFGVSRGNYADAKLHRFMLL